MEYSPLLQVLVRIDRIVESGSVSRDSLFAPQGLPADLALHLRELVFDLFTIPANAAARVGSKPDRAVARRSSAAEVEAWSPS